VQRPTCVDLVLAGTPPLGTLSTGKESLLPRQQQLKPVPAIDQIFAANKTPHPKSKPVKKLTHPIVVTTERPQEYVRVDRPLPNGGRISGENCR
jgi:hypothetical protein